MSHDNGSTFVAKGYDSTSGVVVRDLDQMLRHRGILSSNLHAHHPLCPREADANREEDESTAACCVTSPTVTLTQRADVLVVCTDLLASARTAQLTPWRLCKHPRMTSDDVVPRPQRTLTVAAVGAMVSGVVVAIGAIAPVPLTIVAAAAAAFILSVVMFGVVTYRDARSSGSTFVTALRRSLRTAVKVVFSLMP